MDCVLTIVEEKGVTAERLSIFLLNLRAFTDDKYPVPILSGMRAEIRNAGSVIKIFDILSSKYASFLDYNIFQSILKKYGDEKCLEYPKHLEDFVKKHKIVEFVKINPKLKKLSNTSKKLNIKLSIKKTQSLDSIKRVKEAVASILNLDPSTLRLLSIKKGCVQVTLLIPATIADLLFTRDTKLSADQQQRFREASVLWLECKGIRFDFKEDQSQDHASGKANISIYS